MKEYEEGARRCEAGIEVKCKILLPRINPFPGSAKWLGILSRSLPWHNQHASVCVCVCIREHVQATRESLKCLVPREN